MLSPTLHCLPGCTDRYSVCMLEKIPQQGLLRLSLCYSTADAKLSRPMA